MLKWLRMANGSVESIDWDQAEHEGQVKVPPKHRSDMIVILNEHCRRALCRRGLHKLSYKDVNRALKRLERGLKKCQVSLVRLKGNPEITITLTEGHAYVFGPPEYASDDQVAVSLALRRYQPKNHSDAVETWLEDPAVIAEYCWEIPHFGIQTLNTALRKLKALFASPDREAMMAFLSTIDERDHVWCDRFLARPSKPWTPEIRALAIAKERLRLKEGYTPDEDLLKNPQRLCKYFYDLDHENSRTTDQVGCFFLVLLACYYGLCDGRILTHHDDLMATPDCKSRRVHGLARFINVLHNALPEEARVADNLDQLAEKVAYELRKYNKKQIGMAFT